VTNSHTKRPKSIFKKGVGSAWASAPRLNRGGFAEEHNHTEGYEGGKTSKSFSVTLSAFSVTLSVETTLCIYGFPTVGTFENERAA
jgi:hypothetical protein